MIARARHTTPAPPLLVHLPHYHPAMEIRLASPGDAEAIRAIYNVEVLGSTNTLDMVERTREQQEAWLLEHRGVHPPIWAVEQGPDRRAHLGPQRQVVRGFGSLSPYRERSGYAATAEISVYVGRAKRGKGVGRALLAELL